ncbi:ATP-binding protein [uncultured Desulfobacter sp.]|uniref:PAS domain-containing sensor histidine kinase n=1 Tax=uncultured Desulfobacter sp. TaxID=240139 RepID=UPI0029F45EAF|nr:ATP-binding protein [uncultured Desulfobacter sp.]
MTDHCADCHALKFWFRKLEEESAANYQELFENAPMMCVVLENQHGEVVLRDCNALFLSLLGYTRKEVIGRAVSKFYTADSREKMYHEQNLKRIRESTFITAERELVCRDGEIIHTLIQAIPDMDEHGNIIDIRCMFTNISAHKRAQEQLRESNHLLMMILDGICDPLMILDRNMGVLIMNRAAETYTDRDGSQCLGRKCHEIFKSTSRPCAGCCVEQVFGSGCKKQYERAGLMNPDALERVTVYPIREQGYHNWAAIVRVSDITLEQQMKNELIQADKMISLGILVSGVAHEINNPNHLIMSNTPLLIEAWQSSLPVLDRYYRENGDFSLGGLLYSRMREEIPQLFNGIIESSVRIQQIVKDLKNYTRQEEVDMDQAVDLNLVVRNAVRLNQNLIDEKTDYFSLALGSSLPVIRGNRQKLEQVIINLIQNACQAISDRKQGLDITTFLEPDRNCLSFRVKDQGHGIPENLLNRIMNPFFTTRRGQGGTGLGLAVCLNIVTTHGGKIKVASKPGQGAVFTVSLPLNKASKTCLYDQVPGELSGESSSEALL